MTDKELTTIHTRVPARDVASRPPPASHQADADVQRDKQRSQQAEEDCHQTVGATLIAKSVDPRVTERAKVEQAGEQQVTWRGPEVSQGSARGQTGVRGQHCSSQTGWQKTKPLKNSVPSCHIWLVCAIENSFVPIHNMFSTLFPLLHNRFFVGKVTKQSYSLIHAALE